ncbi:MAG: hypothetical protein Q7T50_02745, partial [Candidatus Magasanikbacteria bacterium]|nr:hypothetical protein [Candidatus Magasanikbacteria bacterium]
SHGREKAFQPLQRQRLDRFSSFSVETQNLASLQIRLLFYKNNIHNSISFKTKNAPRRVPT